mgnify:CR=1 FL=1
MIYYHTQKYDFNTTYITFLYKKQKKDDILDNEIFALLNQK